jgi:hypothetical protein
MEITIYTSKDLVDKLRARVIGIKDFLDDCRIQPTVIHRDFDKVEFTIPVKITI